MKKKVAAKPVLPKPAHESNRFSKLAFRLRFHTKSGQSLFLTGDHELFGNDDPSKALPLERVDDSTWQTTIYLPPGALSNTDITYNYVLRDTDGTLTQDWGNDRAINLATFTQDAVLIVDSWNFAGFYENAFYTEPFKQVLLKANNAEVPATPPAQVTHLFRVKAPLLAKGQTLCLLGSNAELGNWNTANPILLNRKANEDHFTVQLDFSNASLPLTYKYGVYDVVNRQFVRYEDGDNRTLNDAPSPGKLTIVNDGFAVLPSTTWKGAGVAVPVFSLRTENSFGVGEFTDLKQFADWASQAGLKLIQLLPINDTTATHTWVDSYPYAAISAFALHPIYIDLSRVVSKRNQPLLQKLERKRKRLNALAAVDYEAVLNAKLEFLKQIYPSQGPQTLASRDYLEFFAQNKHWLVPYAAFCYLRDKHGTSDFNQWPEHRQFNVKAISKLVSPRSKTHHDIAFHFFIQYHLHVQLKDAAAYAHDRGIIMKGDIAIGVYRYGADAWQQPELYHMDKQAGAPPDDFAVKGQNWGFPTYNWERMQANGFAWWKQRFGQMSYYFDAFRVDHILGFFRIWSIPMDAVEGILGNFVPAIPVKVDEFTSRGVQFDPERFTKPFITDQVLHDLFAEESEWVKSQFLKPGHAGHYSLRPEFNTQRKVADYFAGLEHNERNEKLKLGLFDLISNVILFPTEKPNEFHFRFAMDGTPSFKNLDGHAQTQVRDLYIDYFYRRQDAFWMKEAMQKLPALKRVTNMLVCGEDLGLVPGCVPEVMRQLGLLSLEIQRMPKDPHREFFHPKDAPYLSVVTPATHDMSTIRGWWEEDRARTQKFFNHELGQQGDAPYSCEPWVNKAIVAQHLNSPAMWSIFQIQDLLGMNDYLRREHPEDERINVPAIPKHYWRYRMHLTLEELRDAGAFNEELRGMVRQSGR